MTNSHCLRVLVGAVILLTGAAAACTRAEPTPIPLPQERSAAEREAAVAAIRALAEVPDLALTYVETKTHTENSAMIVEVYESADAEYMVSVADDTVVYMQANSVGPVGQPRLTPDELEIRVRQFLTAHNPCFASAEEQLSFELGNKGDNFFFRWQMAQPNPARPLDQPTFVQVSILADGTIFGYVDSGMCGLVD